MIEQSTRGSNDNMCTFFQGLYLTPHRYTAVERYDLCIWQKTRQLTQNLCDLHAELTCRCYHKGRRRFLFEIDFHQQRYTKRKRLSASCLCLSYQIFAFKCRGYCLLLNRTHRFVSQIFQVFLQCIG